MWGDWWLKVRRRYQALFGHDWKTGDLPINQAFWAGLAATVQIPNYKGANVTANPFEWWMWYTWMTFVASNWQRFPYDAVGFKPYWYPNLPWNPPATPDAKVTRNNSPSDFEVTYTELPDRANINRLLCFWVAINPRILASGQPSHFIEWWATTYYNEPPNVRVPYDFSAILPRVNPGTRAMIGWAHFITLHWNGASWDDVYQVTPRRWLAFNFA